MNFINFLAFSEHLPQVNKKAPVIQKALLNEILGPINCES